MIGHVRSAVLGVALCTGQTLAQEHSLRPADRVRIAESFRLAAQVQDSVWPGWSTAPMALLLVTPDAEFLVRHPSPTSDFSRIGFDSLLQSDVYQRPRITAPGLMATYPAVGGIATVVIGQPERTNKSSTDWVLTVLHEHFHQLQFSQPGYYARVDSLDLSGGDQTGMWMLNYPFPYDSAGTQRRFAQLQATLAAAVAAIGTPAFASAHAKYLDAWRDLNGSLKPADARYLAFQAWQEGVSRYIEYRVAKLGAAVYQPTAEFKALPDYTSFADAATSIRQRISRGLESATLAQNRRVVFYAVGASQAFLLDAASPRWQADYFARPFTLDVPR